MTAINVNVDTQIKDEKSKIDELEALKEVNEMVNNPDKYSRYSNSEDLKKALLSDY